MSAQKKKIASLGELEKRVYEELKKEVLRGAFSPGFHLVERDLAARFNASRTPVRSALQRLETEGLVERRDGRGFRVRLPDIQSALEMLDVREAVEGMAARLSARNANAAQKQQFLDIITEMESCERNSDAINYYRLCGNLHRAIFSAANNATLHDFVLNVSAQSTVLHYKTLLLAKRIDQSIAEHKAIVQAIVDGDEDSAEQHIRRHIREIKHLVANLNQLNSMTDSVL